MNTDGTGFHTCKECHKTESLWSHTTTDHKEGEQLEDRRSVGASSCNSGDGTDQKVQSSMFMMTKTNQTHQRIELFDFGITLYTFRTVVPSIIRSSRLYIQQPNRCCSLLASGYPLASREQYLFDKCLLLYLQSWTPDDGRKGSPKHVECHSKSK